MSKEKIKVTLQILENTYPLMCEIHERSTLIEAAELFNQKLQEMRQANPKLTLERLVTLGGLQMTFESLQEKHTLEREVSTVNEISERLLSAFDMALNEDNDKKA